MASQSVILKDKLGNYLLPYTDNFKNVKETMPSPNVLYLGVTILYLGLTDTYINGHLYKCESLGEDYIWSDVTPEGQSNSSSGSGTSITWHIINSNTTAQVNHGYMIDASNNAVELTLPSSFTLGDTIPIRVINLANTIIIKKNGNKIEGLAEDLIIDIDKSGFHLTASDMDNGWLITTKIDSPGNSNPQFLTSDKTVYVGTGYHSTITEALNYLTNTYVSDGAHKATIEILSGTSLNEKIFLYNCNLSWITITSENDAEVSIDMSGWSANDAFMTLVNAQGPTIDFILNSNGTETVLTKFYYLDNSSLRFIAGAGAKTSKTLGYILHVTNSSSVTAPSTVWYGGNRSVFIDTASRLYADSIVINGGITGMRISSGSSCSCISASFTGGASSVYGMIVTGASNVTVKSSTFSGYPNGINANDASTVTASSSSFTGTSTSGTTIAIQSTHGAVVTAYSVTCNTFNYGAITQYGGVITANGPCTFTSVTVGALTQVGGIIYAYGTTYTVSQTVNVWTADGLILR